MVSQSRIFALLMMLCTLSAQVEVHSYSPANTVIFFDLHDVILKRDNHKRIKIALKNPMGALRLVAYRATNKEWVNGEKYELDLKRKGDKKQAELIRQLSAAYKIDMDVFSILQTLKAKGYTICMASNIGAGHLNDLRHPCHPRNKAKHSGHVTINDVFALFDDLIFVDYENQDVIHKPDPRYFEQLRTRSEFVKGCGRDKRIIFVDDNKKNIAAAHACGIHGIRFKSAHKLAHDLKSLGIL